MQEFWQTTARCKWTDDDKRPSGTYVTGVRNSEDATTRIPPLSRCYPAVPSPYSMSYWQHRQINCKQTNVGVLCEQSSFTGRLCGAFIRHLIYYRCFSFCDDAFHCYTCGSFQNSLIKSKWFAPYCRWVSWYLCNISYRVSKYVCGLYPSKPSCNVLTVIMLRGKRSFSVVVTFLFYVNSPMDRSPL